MRKCNTLCALRATKLDHLFPIAVSGILHGDSVLNGLLDARVCKTPKPEWELRP